MTRFNAVNTMGRFPASGQYLVILCVYVFVVYLFIFIKLTILSVSKLSGI